jgi:hypothetical protein
MAMATIPVIITPIKTIKTPTSDIAYNILMDYRIPFLLTT